MKKHIIILSICLCFLSACSIGKKSVTKEDLIKTFDENNRVIEIIADKDIDLFWEILIDEDIKLPKKLFDTMSYNKIEYASITRMEDTGSLLIIFRVYDYRSEDVYLEFIIETNSNREFMYPESKVVELNNITYNYKYVHNTKHLKTHVAEYSIDNNIYMIRTSYSFDSYWRAINMSEFNHRAVFDHLLSSFTSPSEFE